MWKLYFDETNIMLLAVFNTIFLRLLIVRYGSFLGYPVGVSINILPEDGSGT